MPISATDALERRSEAGFTLLEMLVVVTIIALLSAAVVLGAPAGGTSLREEAERLAARARAAQEHAIIANRAIAMRLDAAGYSFSVRGGGAWHPAAAPAAGRWEEGTRPRGPGRVLFDAAGATEPVELVLERARERVTLDFLAEGDVRVRRPS